MVALLLLGRPFVKGSHRNGPLKKRKTGNFKVKRNYDNTLYILLHSFALDSAPTAPNPRLALRKPC